MIGYCDLKEMGKDGVHLLQKGKEIYKNHQKSQEVLSLAIVGEIRLAKKSVEQLKKENTFDFENMLKKGELKNSLGLKEDISGLEVPFFEIEVKNKGKREIVELVIRDFVIHSGSLQEIVEREDGDPLRGSIIAYENIDYKKKVSIKEGETVKLNFFVANQFFDEDDGYYDGFFDDVEEKMRELMEESDSEFVSLNLNLNYKTSSKNEHYQNLYPLYSYKGEYKGENSSED